MLGFPESSPGHRKHVEIGAREHGIKSILIFHQAPIPGFCVAKLALDDTKCVLHLAANREFAVLDQALPINGTVGTLSKL